jgi:hypothetical protein
MGNKIKFHLDENVSYNIALGLRQRGLDVTTTPEDNGRVIFTQDTDFLRINQSSITHAGIAYCPQQSKSIGQIIRGLLLIWEILEPEEMYNHIEFI